MNKKRMAAIAVAVATLGSLSVTPADATIFKENDNVDQSSLEWYEENAVTEAIIYVGDAGEGTGYYYFKTPGNEPSIDLSPLSEEDMRVLNLAFPVKIDDYSIDVSSVERVITIDDENDKGNYIPIDCGACYTHISYYYEVGEWEMELSAIQKPTLGDSDSTDGSATVGDSGDSEPSETTLLRGDVNGDGVINGLDLLRLKKYLLGLIDSLE
jgi:hypothetical protein